MPTEKPHIATQVEKPIPRPPWVVLVGFPQTVVDELRAAVETLGQPPASPFKIQSFTAHQAEALPRPELLDGDRPTVLVLGPELPAEDGRKLIQRASDLDSWRQAHNIVLGAGVGIRHFHDLVIEDRAYFLAQELPSCSEISVLIRAALSHASLYGDPRKPRTLRRLFGHGPKGASIQTDSPAEILLTEVVGQKNLAGLLGRTTRMLERLVSADRTDCYLYEPASDTVRSFQAPGHEQDSLAAGTIAFALRTGCVQIRERTADSPFYDADLDGFRVDGHGQGDGKARILAVPLTVHPRMVGRGPARSEGPAASEGPQGVKPADTEATADEGYPAFAVWLAWRAAHREPFHSDDARNIQRTTAPLIPLISDLILQEEQQNLLRQSQAGADSPGSGGSSGQRISFRAEALQHYYEGAPDHGEVLRISPEWTRYAYPLLLLLFLSAIVFSIFGKVNEYAEGVGIVRLQGRVDVNAQVGGTVSRVLAQPGQAVEKGQLLVKLYDVQEEAELERIQREFELGLLDRLRRPADPVTARTLGTLRAQRQLALSRLEERSVRAPVAGIASDLRVQPGQLLAPGEIILSLHRQDENRRLLGILPGHYRPQVQVGMPLRFEPEGFRYAYQHLVVDAVSDEVFGPTEARRMLGPGIGDAVPISGPVLLIEARLPTGYFESQGTAYSYHEGSLGRLELKVRSERILVTLVPGLKALFADREAPTDAPPATPPVAAPPATAPPGAQTP